jgi:hypothetical protein
VNKRIVLTLVLLRSADANDLSLPIDVLKAKVARLAAAHAVHGDDQQHRVVPDLAGRVTRTGCKQPLNIAPCWTPRKTLQSVNARRIECRETGSTPMLRLGVAEEVTQLGHVKGNAGPLQLALCKRFEISGDIFQRNLLQRLPLPVEPRQEFHDTELVVMKGATRKTPFMPLEIEKGVDLRGTGDFPP